jgi:hypothetical protein
MVYFKLMIILNSICNPQNADAEHSAGEIAGVRDKFHRNLVLALRKFGGQRKRRVKKLARAVAGQFLRANCFSFHDHIKFARAVIAAPESAGQLHGLVGQNFHLVAEPVGCVAPFAAAEVSALRVAALKFVVGFRLLFADADGIHHARFLRDATCFRRRQFCRLRLPFVCGK